MSANLKNQVAFLRTTREFPREDPNKLVQEIDKAYIDTAICVNSRIIGLFATNSPTQNGETWVLAGQRQQGLRKVFTFTATTSIAHSINFNTVERFTRCWGTYTDGTNWYGLPFGTSVAVAGLITFYVSPTNIVFMTGAGAPSLTSGTIVLEWISNI